MRFLTLVVVLAAIAVVGAELVAPPRIEEAIEARVAERVPEASSVTAELSGFPVVARALATGKVPRLVVVLDEVAHPEVTISSVEIEVTGIEISRRALVDGEVDLERVDRAQLGAVVTEADLEQALAGGDIDLTLRPGRVEATVAGRSVGSDATVAGGRITFDLGPLPDVSVALPGPELFPCPLGGEVVQGAVRLGCVLEQVPDYLLRRLDAAAPAVPA
ncbi:MAG: DUF2993 domain-containing protein [Actinobacteria bacterium]|nr:DUF2993 domain-containing protein [Actinomycetota bacterium]MBW3642717.1 DUF2993 domain-containing protein [Actinomycetota bacterium]